MIQRWLIVDPHGPSPDMIEYHAGPWVKYMDIQKALQEAYAAGKKDGIREGYNSGKQDGPEYSWRL